MAKKQWIYENVDNTKFIELKSSLKLTDPLISSLLKRNVDTFNEAKEFFRPNFSQLSDSFLLKDVQKAIKRLTQAIHDKEKILIYGDYDVDGVTSVSIIYNFFSKLYNNIHYYIPDRHKEGYGMSEQSVRLAKQNGYNLILALDCGTSNIDEIALAKKLELDVIIIDHHIATNTLPNAIAIINPKQSECKYKFKDFAACGLCFKFIHAFATEHKIPLSEYYHLLELAAIGTASDLVPLVNENRVITFLGLQILNTTPSINLQAILNIYNSQIKYTTQDIAFKIAPLINAAGRMAHASLAVELLTTDNISTARKLSSIIYNHNTNRKTTEKHITQEALEIINKQQIQSSSTIIYNENWHKGIIGIVASKLQDFHYKPTIVLTKSNDLIVGSARSVEGFNIYESIRSCSHLLEQYGGHMYAAGLSLKPENLETFKNLFEQSVQQNINKNLLIEKIKIDALISLKQITPTFLKIIDQFEPFGQCNETLLFASKNVTIQNNIISLSNNHLKFYVQQDNIIFECIAFNSIHLYEQLIRAKLLTICYTINENIWRDKKTTQLIIKDLKINTSLKQPEKNNISNVYNTSR